MAEAAQAANRIDAAVARIASTVLVVALLAATAAAFALTQGLKNQPSPIFGTKVDAACSRRSATASRTAVVIRSSCASRTGWT